jgi:transcriptional regulator with XRE-family HTH domain
MEGWPEEENDAVAEISFSRLLKELRARAGLTQAALAERAGLGRISIAQLEGGIREPSWKTLVKLARAMNASLGDFTLFEESTAKKQARKR